MKHGWSLLLFALLLHAYAATAHAQTNVQTDTDDAGMNERVELERKAFGLVDEALAEAPSLKLLENRIRAQATAARMLWPRDAKAARAAFKAAADGVVEMNAANDQEDPQPYNVAQLRNELVMIASPFDANLALELLRATRPTSAEALAAADPNHSLEEKALEMSIVANLAAQEPQRALEIAEESLGKGVSRSLINVVLQMAAKDPDSASKLAVKIARSLSPEDLRSQNEAVAVAQQLLQMTRPSTNSTGPVPISVGNDTSVVGGGVAVLDEQVRRELFEKLFSAMSAGAPRCARSRGSASHRPSSASSCPGKSKTCLCS